MAGAGPHAHLGREGIQFGGTRMRFTGANAASTLRLEQPRRAHSHYLLGPDVSQWRENVPQFDRVRQPSIYPGIDLVYYFSQGKLEFDFELDGAADPNRIQLEFNAPIKIVSDRDLAAGELLLAAPVAYQSTGGIRRRISASWVRRGERTATLALGSYDRGKRVVIDPVLTWSTYIGGSSDEFTRAISADRDGNVCITGSTTSTDFNQPDSPRTRFGDVFVARFTPSGELLYYTVLGGGQEDVPLAIATHTDGSAYITGWTDAGRENFPVRNAYQSVIRGASDAFVIRLSPTGELMYSTFLGGPGIDKGSAIAVDASGHAYVAVESDWQQYPPARASVAKIDLSGQRLHFTYSFEQTGGLSLALDADGGTWVAGITFWASFPIRGAEVRPISRGLATGFLSKITADGSDLSFSTVDKVGGRLLHDPLGRPYYWSTLEPRYGPLMVRSIDAGAAWEARDSLGPDEPFGNLAFSPLAPFYLYATAGQRFLRSSDGGQSWETLLEAPTGSVSYSLHPTDPNTIYALFSQPFSGNTLYRSTDGGRNWKDILRLEILGSLVIDETTDTLYIGSCSFFGECVTEVSHDSGETWKELSSGNVPLAASGGVLVAIDSTGKLLRSADAAATWTSVLDSVGGVKFDSFRSGKVYAWNADSLWISADAGISWLRTAQSEQIYSLQPDPRDPDVLYAVRLRGVARSTDGGKTWTKLLTAGEETSLAIDPQSSGTLLAGFRFRVTPVFNPTLQRLGSGEPARAIGSLSDYVFGVPAAVDTEGNLYLSGAFRQSSNPVVFGSLTNPKNVNFVKIGQDGVMEYQVLAGGGRDDLLWALDVDANGSVFAAGTTGSSEFPVKNAAQSNYRGNRDAFLMQIAPR